MEFDSILVRYGEISLKGGNRKFFENKLASNIRWVMDREGVEYKDVRRIQGRFMIETGDVKAVKALGRVFGIASYSPSKKINTDMNDMRMMAVDVVREMKPETFRVTAQRLDKRVESTSQRINQELGEAVVEGTGTRVDLKNPELEVGFDVTKEHSYAYTKRIHGLGGLPVGVSSRILCLLSGGIDSPVAAWMMMKRGCSVTLVHFMHGNTIPSKIRRISEVLGGYCPGLKTIIVPAGELEREIISKVPAKYRIVVMRRMFLNATEKMMSAEKAHAIVTGDSVGQVASQTIENIRAIQKDFKSLVLRPLACMDKQEVVDLAVKIGSYDASILDYNDCCNFLVPKHPETRTGEHEVVEWCSKLDEGVMDSILESKRFL
ncbi:MAG: tRNA uracil 4-sulfurtransferase ThiI [Candidatus Altiarchaeota archaeon]